MFLQDCEIEDCSIEYGDLGINGKTGYEIIPSVNNNPVLHFISAHPKSYIKFKISPLYRFFSCQIALNDSSDNDAKASFEIKVDGETSFYSRNLSKNKIQNVQIFLNENSTIELFCEYSGASVCHALWIQPELFQNPPKNLIDAFQTTLISTRKYFDEKLDYCIACYFDENNFKYFKNFHENIMRHTTLNIEFIVFCEDYYPQIREFSRSTNTRFIKISDIYHEKIIEKNRRGFLNKASLFSIAKFINSNKYLLIDVDIVTTKDVKEIFDLIEDEETLYVTRDAHTEGLTFGEIVTEPWSAYEGTPKCKDILKLTPEECASELILNSGVIAGHRKAILGLESELFKMLPLSKFYFNENADCGLREQSVVNLATIRYEQYEILPKKYNLQVLWEEIILKQDNEKITAVSEDFEPLFVHFNGPSAKGDLSKIYNDLSDLKDFKYSKEKIGRDLSKIFKDKNNLKILDVQTNETISQSLKNTCTVKCEITRILNKRKILSKNNEIIETSIKDLYSEMKKISTEDTFDLIIVSNLESKHNILTKMLLASRMLNDGYLCFNEYDYAESKMDTLLKNSSISNEYKIEFEKQENKNQKIYLLRKICN